MSTKDKRREKHPDCKCHKTINGRVTCLLSCMRCSGAKKVVTTEEKGYKKLEVYF